MEISPVTTVTTSTPVKKTVGDPIPQYMSLRNTWERSRAILNGQAGVKAYDSTVNPSKNILIPFSPSMTSRQYEFYKSEGELPGLVAQYAKVLVGGLLRKNPTFTLPQGIPEDEAREWLTNSFSSDGNSMLSTLDSALWEELQTSRAWLLVDHPTITEAELLQMTVEEKAKINPYTVNYRAENVINWRIGKTALSSSQILTKFTVRMYTEKYTIDNPHHPDLIDTVIDYYLDETGHLCVQRYYAKNLDEIKVSNGEVQTNFSSIGGGKDWIADGELVMPMMQGKRIPFIPAYPLNGSLQADEPLLQPLIDREIGLYNKISRRNHLLYGAASYTPVISDEMGDEAFQKIVEAGLGSWILLGKGGKAEALQTPTDALADYEKAIASTIEEMARMGIRMLSPEGSSGESGISLEIRNAAQTAQLGLLNTKISKTLQTVIGVMLRWKYGSDLDLKELTFTLSEDFSPTPLGVEWLRLITEWYKEGIIPRTLWLSIGKQNDIIPTDYDDTAGKTEIQGDSLLNLDKKIDSGALE
jgi:hypothetical protein